MDGFKAQVAGAGCVGGSIACICCMACCAGAITFVVFLGKYAFANPNLPAWYGMVGDADALFPTEALANAAKASDVSDVHGHMVTWFLWGFIQSLLPIATGILGAIFGAISPALGACMSGLGGLGVGCGGLAWYITGLVWRFNSAGSYASGDVMPEGATEAAWEKAITCDPSKDATCIVQYSSGNFMYVYFLITWICMGTACGCSLIGAIVACACK